MAGTDGAGTYRAGELTAGPWSADLQHGGPPNALAVLLAERVVRERSGRRDFVAVRLASDFLGPVPVGDVDVDVRVIRLARSAAACEVTVRGSGRDCLVARVWFVRLADTSAVATPVAAPPPPPPADVPRRAHADVRSGAQGWGFGYARSLRWWFTDGHPAERGPAGAWVLPLHPVLEGTDGDLPGLARVALVADSASGTSAELDWAHWSFVNVDLDVHLSRPFEGEWVHMAAVSTLGGSGSALARSTLSDVRGEVGSGLQTLVLRPMPTA